MIKSMKKLINKTIYESSAEYPWARFKDFILSEDGMYVEKALIISESLIPVPYTVSFCDFKSIGDKNAVLKEGVKPHAERTDENNPYRLSNLRKYKFLKDGHRQRFFDISFDTEAGEVVDFIIISPNTLTGRKIFLSPDQEELKELMTAYLKK